MATNSSGDSIFGAAFGPIAGFPRTSIQPIFDTAATTDTLTTAGGARTLTAAEVLGYLFILNVDDAQTATLPTAALLNAAIPGVHIGATLRVRFVNVGDATLTVAVGTGGTLTVGNSKATAVSCAAAATLELLIRVTAVLGRDGSDAYMVLPGNYLTSAVA